MKGMKKNYFFTISLLLFASFGTYAQWQDTARKATCNLDDTCQFIISIDSVHGKYWHIGTPHKSFFGEAYSKPVAIMTDTVNAYVPGTKTYFDLIIPNAFGFAVEISFKHKFQTSLHKDGGYLQYSLDQGK